MGMRGYLGSAAATEDAAAGTKIGNRPHGARRKPMTTEFLIYSDTDFSLCSHAAQEDARVIRQIEARAVDLSRQLDHLEARWNRRTEKLERNSGGRMGYKFRDALC